MDPDLDPDPQPWVVVGFSNLWRGKVFLNVSYLSLPWFYGRSCDSTAAGGYLTRTWLLNKKVSYSRVRTTNVTVKIGLIDANKWLKEVQIAIMLHKIKWGVHSIGAQIKKKDTSYLSTLQHGGTTVFNWNRNLKNGFIISLWWYVHEFR